MMKTIPINKKTCAVAAVVTVLLAGCAAAPHERSTGEVIDDGVLAARVKAALIENDQTKARQIDVETYHGEVQLNGFVESEIARSSAVTAAKGIKGVTSVHNNLQIRAADRTAGQVVDDGLITTQIKARLIGDSRTKAYQIEIETNAGVVQLGGFVDSEEAKAVATEIARSINGVRSVNNKIEVR
ncbi:MAG: BON domain-containing protein [Steroidobacteraceae bacterium]